MQRWSWVVAAVSAALTLLSLAAIPGRGADPATLEMVQTIALHGPAGKRLYASCGEGVLAVLRQVDAGRFALQEQISTVKLARTCLFDPEAARLYLGVPGQAGKGGPEIGVYRAKP